MNPLLGDVPAAPPPDLRTEVAAAAARARDLWLTGRELHFDARAGRRVAVQLRRADGEVLRSLTPSQVLDVASGLLAV